MGKRAKAEISNSVGPEELNLEHTESLSYLPKKLCLGPKGFQFHRQEISKETLTGKSET